MSVSIALLSGKGGSGKTTLALSMSDLLCRCGIRTLLIDCDLRTNGATFFYEAQLAKQSSNMENGSISFSDLLLDKTFRKPFPLEIRKNLHFLPSVQGISGRYLSRRYENKDFLSLENNITILFDWLRLNYDVVLFDCQDGYTDLLPVLLPQMDIDLFVLEPDSISASAMRSLQLKVGNYFGNAKLYQVFNKASAEEHEVYSKIIGTFFTNIGTLLFDWKVRQAFSRAQVPDLETTSAKFGADLCEICKIMLRDKCYVEQLERFSIRQRYKELTDNRKETEKHLSEEKEELNNFLVINGVGKAKLFLFLRLLLSIGVAFVLMFILAGDEVTINISAISHGEMYSLLITGLVIISSFVVLLAASIIDNIVTINSTALLKKARIKRIQDIEQRIIELDDELKQIEQIISK